MGFQPLIVADLPRVRCADHGVETVAVPWAGALDCFPPLFDASTNWRAADCTGSPGRDRERMHQIINPAVGRGLLPPR